MSADSLSIEVRDRVAVLTLNRPEKLNAFGAGMGEALGEAYRRFDADDSVRAVVVTGAGRAFCAGADMAPAGDTFAAPKGDHFDSSPIKPPAWEVRKPVIAAINGHAIGIGLTIAMQADFRLVAEDAKLGIVQVRRGVLGDAHSHWTVPRAVGYARAAEILMLGRMFSGLEAASWGLANRALPAAEVLPAALELARDFAVNTAPLSVAVSKRLLWQSPPPDRDDVGRLETALHLVTMGRPDAREGVMAFVEKREPRWQMSPTRDWPEDLFPR